MVHLRDRGLDGRGSDRILVGEKRLKGAQDVRLDANDAAVGAGGVIDDALPTRFSAASAGLQLVTK